MFDYSPNILPEDSYGAGEVIKHAEYGIGSLKGREHIQGTVYHSPTTEFANLVG
jgi:hypothetical protein